MADSPDNAPLRLSALEITNFRTFREATTIPLGRGDKGDAIITFHGLNGSGKSNAIRALVLYFEGVLHLFARDLNERPASIQDSDFSDHRKAIAVRAFCNVALLSSKKLVRQPLDPEGKLERLDELSEREKEVVRPLLVAPRGPGSRAFVHINARRQISWLPDTPGPSLLAPTLLVKLLGLRTSLRAEERRAWREFVDLVREIPTLRNRSIDVEQPPGAPARLVVEDEGRSVLTFDQLSSGEQQLITLFGGILLSRASIIAIEEPEVNLDLDNQRLLRRWLEEWIKRGLADQFIIESHSLAFDGPEVVRFERHGDETKVSRVPSAAREGERAAVADKAKQKGAEERWVTPEGYTQLPEAMRKELGSEGKGAHLWFLKGAQTWEAWPEEQLDELMGGSEDKSGG